MIQLQVSVTQESELFTDFFRETMQATYQRYEEESRAQPIRDHLTKYEKFSNSEWFLNMHWLKINSNSSM